MKGRISVAYVTGLQPYGLYTLQPPAAHQAVSDKLLVMDPWVSTTCYE